MSERQPPDNGEPGTTLPPGMTMPPGFENMTIPPGMSLDNMTLPPEIQDGGGGMNPIDLIGGTNTDLEIDFPIMDGLAMNINATPEFLPNRLFNYEKASATKGMAGIPRFGHTHEISYLAYLSSENGKKSDGEDYILGLLFVGCFLLVFFVTWMIVLLIFKLTLTGFLCGDPFINPNLDDPAEQKRKKEMEEDGEEYIEDPSWLNRPLRIRLVFFICGILQIVFAILMVTKGVANLQTSTDTIQITNNDLRVIIDAAVSNFEDLKQVGETAYVLRDQLVFDLQSDNFCPDNPTFAETKAGRDIMAAAGGAITMLEGMGNFIGSDVAEMEVSMRETKNSLDTIDVAIEDAETYEWLGGLVAFPFLVLSSLMMIGTIAGQGHIMTDCFLCFLNWFILPLFIFLVNLAYVILGLVSIGASVNADFCGGESSTPDQVIVDWMFRSGFNETDPLFQTVRYYAFQCTEQAEIDPFLFLRNFDAQTVLGREVVQNLTRSMDEVQLDQLALGCNRDFRPLHRALGQMVGVLDALLQSGNRAINLLKCDRIVPVYTDIVYNATCTHSIYGFTWIFSSLLLVSIFGMVMIMFRSSFQNTIFERPPTLMDDSSGVNDRQRLKDDGKRSGNKKKKTEDRWSDEEE